MKVLITGAAGLLGHGLTQVFGARHTVFPVTRAEVDTTDAGAVQNAFNRLQPDVVIHTAAIPDLDVCEADPDRAFLVNVEGTRNVTRAASEVGAAVAHISSDAVFDGKKNTPYVESDPVNPQTVYGRTKVDGEQIVAAVPQHWIFRIPVLFGPGKANFVSKGLEKLRKREEYVVASDQVACAAYTLDVAQLMMEIIEARKYGLYHVANAGQCSRLELAIRAAEFAELDSSLIVGKPSDMMNRKAKRLKYSVMDSRAARDAGFTELRSWDEGLREYVLKWKLEK